MPESPDSEDEINVNSNQSNNQRFLQKWKRLLRNFLRLA